jgi:hypothetical protein
MVTLQLHVFFLKGNKCCFGLAEPDFLGFELSGSGIPITEQKIRAITDWRMVCSPNNVQSFLGLAGVYRKFAPDFAPAAIPVFQLLNVDQREFDISMDTTLPTKPMKPTSKLMSKFQSKPTQPSQLTQTDAQTQRTEPAEPSEPSKTGRQLLAEAMNRLKRIITTHPALELPQRGNGDFLVRTHVADYAIGGTLRLMEAGEEKVLAYLS